MHCIIKLLIHDIIHGTGKPIKPITFEVIFPRSKAMEGRERSAHDYNFTLCILSVVCTHPLLVYERARLSDEGVALCHPFGGNILV